ncbi:MAG: hypothetical protein JNM56_38035 [Planctomycetia bacterium]|nr:hypothetical protein [Planctomycetia bacterium]
MKTLSLLTIVGLALLSAPLAAAEPAPPTAVRSPVRLVPHPLRVLILTSGSGSDFQFCHGLAQQLNNRKWAEFTIRYQYQNNLFRGEPFPGLPAAIQVLRFPDRLEADDPRAFPDDRKANLAYYDLIIAFDPDWTELNAEQQKHLTQWVEQGGGLIFAAGPVHSGALASKENQEKLAAVRDLLPVAVADSRRQREQPRRLRFAKSDALPEFLRLDEQGDAPTAGWEEFHTFQDGMVAANKDALLRGFHRCQGVTEVKHGTRVLATFADADFLTPDGQEQPYLATATRGKGTVVYLAAAETFRLRACRISYYERFWINLMLHATAGRLADAPARKPAKLSEPELNFLWEDLASGSPPQAYTAVWSLNRAPEAASTLIRERIRQLPPFDVHERIEALIAQLDSDKFPVRQQAAEELEKLGRLPDPALRKHLRRKPCLEVRQRLETLLERMDKLPPAPDEELRVRRALVVLEAQPTAEVRQFLQELAKGPQKYWLTQQAQAVLDRVAAK